MHFRSIHYLRGIAALLVAVFHIFSNVGFMSKDVGAVYWMRAGVDIFFIISGFVMVQSTDGRNISPKQFAIHRIRRIVPLYWIATFAMMLQVEGQWQLKILSLLFLPAMNPEINMMQPILEPGWTLNYEMFFYLVFATALLLKEKNRIFAVSMLFLALVALGQIIEGGDVFQFYTRTILLEFVLGMAIARFRIYLPPLAIPLGFVAMIALQTSDIDRFWSLGLPAAVIVAGALRFEDRLPHWRIANFLGSASYSIYLFHLLALGTVSSLWPYFDYGNAAFAVVAFTVMIAVGCGMYLTIERPLLALLAPAKPGGKMVLPKPRAARLATDGKEAA
ncbi:MAG: acyltransferase [Sphingorhabdus sp.]|nr:acyltransferase [Sphingorhabdus sp.]